MTNLEFQQMIIEAIKLHGVSPIAKLLTISKPTVERWAEGKSYPSIYMRKPIKKLLEKL